MSYSKGQQEQTTSKEGRPVKVGVELQGKPEAPSIPLAETKREREAGTSDNTSNLLERILARDNMLKAMKRVIANKGSHGVDGMRADELRPFIIEHWPTTKQKLLAGKYSPSPVRRVEIPKADGSKRQLGIPTVLDRLIQQAIAQELSAIYEPTFSPHSYGFRPLKSAHQAIQQAKEYINQGNRWVVDTDLEKFFDKVNHDILMERLSRKVKDKRVLKLIRKYLESGIMVNGVKINSPEGFTKKLYSTYLSYLPADQFSYPLMMNIDARGSFTEFIKTPDRGQVSINISKPGITKGNHWHHTKNEKFLVVSGQGIIKFRKIGSAEVIAYNVSGDKLEVVDIPPGYTHNITNTGAADMVTVMWANEPFDPERPDTYWLEV